MQVQNPAFELYFHAGWLVILSAAKNLLWFFFLSFPIGNLLLRHDANANPAIQVRAILRQAESRGPHGNDD
jgi:hypothetical protein